MSLMEETGARVRSGASPTDDVVTCYYSEVGGETGRAKASGSTSTWRSPLYIYTNAGSGVYRVDPNGGDPGDTFNVYCNMDLRFRYSAAA
jgi:hypothetical protein